MAERNQKVADSLGCIEGTLSLAEVGLLLCTFTGVLFSVLLFNTHTIVTRSENQMVRRDIEVALTEMVNPAHGIFETFFEQPLQPRRYHFYSYRLLFGIILNDDVQNKLDPMDEDGETFWRVFRS